MKVKNKGPFGVPVRTFTFISDHFELLKMGLLGFSDR